MRNYIVTYLLGPLLKKTVPWELNVAFGEPARAVLIRWYSSIAPASLRRSRLPRITWGFIASAVANSEIDTFAACRTIDNTSQSRSEVALFSLRKTIFSSESSPISSLRSVAP